MRSQRMPQVSVYVYMCVEEALPNVRFQSLREGSRTSIQGGMLIEE